MLTQRNAKDIQTIQKQYDSYAEMEKLSCPIQLLYGLKSPFGSLEEGIFAAGILGKTCSLTGIPESSQYPLIEKPQVIAKKIYTFS